MSQTSLIDNMVTDAESNLHPRLQEALGCLQCEIETELTTYRQANGDSNISVTPKMTQELAQDKPIISATEEEDEYEIIAPSEPFAILEDFFTEEKHYAQGEILDEAFLTDSKGGLVATPSILDIDFSPSGPLAPVSGELFSGTLTGSAIEIKAPNTTPTPNHPEPVVAKAPSKPRNAFNPLGIGAALLCMGIAGGAGYTYYYQPQIVSNILGKKTVTTTAPIATEGNNLAVLSGPNLAANEFTPLTLNTITTIKLPSSAPVNILQQVPIQNNLSVPTVNGFVNVPTPVNNKNLSDGLVKSLLPPNLQRLAAPVAPLPQTQQSTTTPGISKNTTKSLLVSPLTLGSNEKGGFTVVTKNQNKGTLAKVKSVAPSAIVNGDRIDIARFPKQDQALNAIKELQKQGINAWILK